MANTLDVIKSFVDTIGALILKLWWVFPIVGVIIALRRGWIDEHTLTVISERLSALFSSLKGLL